MPRKKALIIQHVATESLAENFTRVLLENRIDLDFVRIYESAPAFGFFNPPSLSAIDLHIVLGGPFSANDDYPALRKEREYLKLALASGVPVFGICLGAQMMSKALGGTVEPSGGYQFGLRKIDVTAAGSTDPVFGKIRTPLVPTLHGDCFTIPIGGVNLAEGYMLRRDGSYRKINMAFRYGKSCGFQFEPQLTLAEFRIWNGELRGDYQLMGDNFDPEEEAERNEREFAKFAPVHEAQMRELFIAFLKNAGLA